MLDIILFYICRVESDVSTMFSVTATWTHAITWGGKFKDRAGPLECTVWEGHVLSITVNFKLRVLFFDSTAYESIAVS